MRGSVPTTKVPGQAGAGPGPRVEIAVGLEHGIRVDRQLGDDLLGRRQLIARLKQAELQGLVNLLDQLQVGGDA